MKCANVAIAATSMLLFSGAAVLATQTPAAAPSPFANAVKAQSALGYHPCTPHMAPLPMSVENEGVYADADNGEQSGLCQIRVASAYMLPDSELDWVAWHEVCHLSTVSRIAATHPNPATDWAHQHPFFKACIHLGPHNTGGY